MQENIKKIVYTGVGFAAFTAEKLRETVEKLMNEERISAEEGKRIVEDFVQKASDRKIDFEQQVKLMVDRVMGNFNFSFNGGSSSKLEDLVARIEALESKQANAKADKTVAA
jgi:polyhydroxyalkanoate synthesis regulator phasin